MNLFKFKNKNKRKDFDNYLILLAFKYIEEKEGIIFNKKEKKKILYNQVLRMKFNNLCENKYNLYEEVKDEFHLYEEVKDKYKYNLYNNNNLEYLIEHHILNTITALFFIVIGKKSLLNINIVENIKNIL